VYDLPRSAPREVRVADKWGAETVTCHITVVVEQDQVRALYKTVGAQTAHPFFGYSTEAKYTQGDQKQRDEAIGEVFTHIRDNFDK
jgi:hypothetical protein